MPIFRYVCDLLYIKAVIGPKGSLRRDKNGRHLDTKPIPPPTEVERVRRNRLGEKM